VTKASARIIAAVSADCRG